MIVLIVEVHAQQNSATPEIALNNWRRTHLQEKLYVHTDKNIYAPGEIAWLKVYYVDGSYHRPLKLSEIAYLELVGADNKPLMQTMISLEKNDGGGSFMIPFSLPTGYYKLRCYTQWMRNFDEHFFFEKIIGIINVQQKSRDSVTITKDNYDFGIFPESGNLVDGIESKIAIHITDPFGKGMDGKGFVTDGTDTVAHFETKKMGMGHFQLTPATSHKYIAHIILDNGKNVEKELPASTDNGFVMKVTGDNNEKLLIQIEAKHKSNNTVYLFAHTRGIVKAAALIQMVNNHGEFSIDKNSLDEGVTQLTLFENNQPVCERLYFIFPKNKFRIDAIADASSYERRKKITINIKSSGEENNTTAHLSAAIYKVDSLQQPDEMNIQNYLLLSSDLTGYVESASWYFENNEGRETAMDDLMLTQGWRRFKWTDILQMQKPVWQFAPEYNGEIISARITDKRNGRLLERAPVFLSIPGSDTKFWSSLSDAEGVANFEIKNSFGTREFILQSADSNAVINFVSPFSSTYTNLLLPSFNTQSIDSTASTRKNIYAQVQQAYHEKMLDSFNVSKEDKTPFFIKPDVAYLLDRFTRFTSMEEVMREYIREVNVVNYGGSFHLHVMNGINRMPFQTDPLVLLDGVAMLDMNKFMDYDPFKIKSIAVVTKKYFLGNINYFGIIDCKTYKGDMNGFALDPRSVILDFDGLQQQREFYSPTYETPQQIGSRMPDFRTLLYWNPSLKIPSGSNTNVEFYSSDATGKYVIVIEGISDKGTPATSKVFFEVKK